MATVRDIIAHIESLLGRPLNFEEGIHHGTADAEVKTAAVSWMASPEAITYAGELGAQLLIGHESLYFPYDAAVRNDNPPGWRDWPTNARRRALLEKYGMAFLRLHSSMDELTILDEFASTLGLGKPIFRRGFVRIYEIPECTYGELIEHVKSRIGLEHVRVSLAEMRDKKVRRVGLPWGGMGLFVNVSYIQELISQGVDVLIAGESDNYGFRFAAECGVPMIETSHETSELPGIERFTKILEEAFPHLNIAFYKDERIWTWC